MNPRFGRYRLQARLATGGMAEVYLALDDTPPAGREVVLKRVLPILGADPEFRRMFMQEVQIASTLTHRNIVPVFDAGEIEGEAYLTMEYVRGRDLARVLLEASRRGEGVPGPHAAYICAELCEALAFAHGKHVVHRDVSPANVLISDAGEVKLADFGIAKAARSSVKTRPDMRPGKAGYLSPEQALGRSLSGASDVFGAGILLWEMLTARRLFSPESDPLAAPVNIAPEDPTTLSPEVPKELSDLALAALSRDPEARPSPHELAKSLAHYLSVAAPGYRPADLAAYAAELAPHKGPEEVLSPVRGGGTRQIPADPGATQEAPAPTPPSQAPQLGRKRRGGLTLLPFLILGVLGVPAALGVLHKLSPGSAPPSTQTPTPPATATPTPAVVTAELVLHTTPANARVQVNGVPQLGTSPFTLEGLPPDTDLTIGITAPGYAPLEKIVRAGDKPVEVRLRRLTGTLTIQSLPFYAEVFVDGKRVTDATPLVQHRLPTGEHKIRLVNPAKGVDQEFTVRIRSGETTKKIVELTAAAPP